MKTPRNKFDINEITNKLLQVGSSLLFAVAVLILAYLSFVKSFQIQPSWQTMTVIGVVTLVMNWLIWDTKYKDEYEKVLQLDKNNKDYCIHKRYYEARRGWKYNDLQDKIRQYNKDFLKAWLNDVEDITGRTIKEIEEGPIKGMPHKHLIVRIKKKLYPKSGIKTPRDLLYILSVGKADSMKIKVKAEETYHTTGRINKIFTSMLGAILSASFVFEFIDGNWWNVILRIIITVVFLFMSFFFGAIAGQKGGKLKLSTAEEVSEKLEEWKNIKPSQEPYLEKEVIKVEENKETLPVIEIT